MITSPPTYKLTDELKQLEVLTSQINAYLDSELLFWPTNYPEVPRITLGAYLVRHNRLLGLRRMLSNMRDQNKLDEVVSRFEEILFRNCSKFQQKAYQELAALLQQWDEYIEQLDKKIEPVYRYRSIVETRVMIEDMFQKFSILSYPLETSIVERIDQLDLILWRSWQSGKFIWPAEWQPVYPQSIYWWLYGKPYQNLKVKATHFKRAGEMARSSFISPPH